MAVTEQELQEIRESFNKNKHRLNIFLNNVRTFFAEHPELALCDPPLIHSVKYRVKDEDHLKEKIIRKSKKKNYQPINGGNLFVRVTDLAGVRVLHLYQGQFQRIHEAIVSHINDGEWALYEDPKAYTWDPESAQYFRKLGLKVQRKESFYTSVHYVVKPRPDSDICCEIQVRTLFEEIWGEIDHTINYPKKSKKKDCQEQILVLAKLVGAGSRLADSIFSSHDRN